MSVQAFYDELAPRYHLVYENWEASVAWQGKALASLIGGVRTNGQVLAETIERVLIDHYHGHREDILAKLRA